MPLDFTAKSASKLALEWTTFLKDAAAAGDPLAFDESTEVSDVQSLGTSVVVRFRGSPRDLNPYGALIWAGGAGVENCTIFPPKPASSHVHPTVWEPDREAISCYEGPPFWSNDTFAQRNVDAKEPPASVLIAGSGDGALQDLLRIVTGKDSARELFVHCNVPPDVARCVQSAEDRAIRGWAWSRHGTAYEHAIYREVQDVHDRAAMESLEDPDVTASLEDLTRGAPEVHLVYRCDHLTAFYGLNRFLATLVLKFFEQRGTGPVFHHPRSAVVDLQPHPAGRGTLRCVRIAPWDRCTDGCAAGDTKWLEANVVIVRYGITPETQPRVPRPSGKEQPAETFGGRQLLPYHLSG